MAFYNTVVMLSLRALVFGLPPSTQQFINLIANSSKPYPDSSYALMDAYINTCLSKTSTCSRGFTLVVNVTLRASPSDRSFDSSYSHGRLALLSAGGAESVYSPSGFYLHALHARNDDYLEFGYVENEKIYLSKV
jgi:hypothetical protein